MIAFVRSLPLVLVAAAMLPASVAAQEPPVRQDSVRQDSARVTDRIHPDRAERALITRHRDFALLIAGDELLAQLTDRGLEEFRASMDDEESLASRILGAMLQAGMRQLLDNAIAIPIAGIARAEVVDGRLVLEDDSGDEFFDLSVNDRDVMEDFSEREARAFASELRRRARSLGER
jgi:hypothetical protein